MLQGLPNGNMKETKTKEEGLLIENLPISTRKWFLQFADSEEFKSKKEDKPYYGFAFKYLCDFFISCGQVHVSEIMSKINYMSERLTELENQKETEKDIILCNGTRIKR
jgi:hypothetical protein